MDQNLVPIRKSKRDREASWAVTPEINESIFLEQAKNVCEVQKWTRLEVLFFKAEDKIKQINMFQLWFHLNYMVVVLEVSIHLNILNLLLI